MNGRAPRVFISSVTKGYEGFREAISRRIEDDFRWEVWCSGVIDPHIGGFPPLEVCLERVEWADLYIGIFGKRYGTILEPPGLSFTELEYQNAAKNRKFIYLYIEDYSPLPKNKLIIEEKDEVRSQCFIEFVKDPHIGQYVRSFNPDKMKSLYKDKIRPDLEVFGKKWVSGKLKRARLYIMDILSDWHKIQNELEGWINIWDIKPSHGRLDEGLVKDKMREMSSYYDQKSFCDALQAGLIVLNELKRVPPLKYGKQRVLWAKFLEKWVNTYSEMGNWGTFGPIPATKSLIQIYQSLGDLQEMYGTANSMASLYYSKGDYRKALIWSNLSKSIKGPLWRERSKFSVRGRILLKYKKYKEAAFCFRNCLNLNNQKDNASYGLHKSGLGLAEIGMGNEREGLSKLEEGKRICEKRNNPGFLVRTKIALAEYYMIKERIPEAREEVREAKTICERFRLAQISKITALESLLNIEP